MRYFAAVLLVLVVGACGGEDSIPSRLSIVVQGSIECDGSGGDVVIPLRILDADTSVPKVDAAVPSGEDCTAAVDSGDHWTIACANRAPSRSRREFRINKALDGGEFEWTVPEFTCGSVVVPIVSVEIIE